MIYTKSITDSMKTRSQRHLLVTEDVQRKDLETGRSGTNHGLEEVDKCT